MFNRIKKFTPLDDLEMFELIRAAYPEKFSGDDDDTWEAAQSFADGLSGWEDVADLLGRVVMLSAPMKSHMTGQLSHCLGRVTVAGDSMNMVSVISRPIDA